MTGKVAAEKAAFYADENDAGMYAMDVDNATMFNVSYSYSTTQIATVLSFCVGIWQVWYFDKMLFLR